MSSIFNDLGKKLTLASQDAVKKAKELAEIAKLNGQILDEERKINKYYTEIGQQYAELFADSAEEPFVTLLKKLNDSNHNIQKYRTDIKEIKNIKTCDNCGSTFVGDAVYCSSCGEKQADAVEKVYESDDIYEDEDVIVVPHKVVEESSKEEEDVIVVNHIIDENIEGSDI